MRRQALGHTCPPWPSALLCGQPSARWARGKLGLASAGQARRAELEPLPQEAAQVCSSPPDAWPRSLLCHHHFGWRSTDPGEPRPPPGWSWQEGQGWQGCREGTRRQQGLLSESPFSYGPLGYHSVSHFLGNWVCKHTHAERRMEKERMVNLT